MSKFNRVAKMGSNSSKYGESRNDFEKGDRVRVRFGAEILREGVVTRVTAKDVYVKSDDNNVYAHPVRFVELA